MTFQEIFQEDGLYKADSFKEGICLKVEDGFLKLVCFLSKDDMNPRVENAPVHKSYFGKEYTKVFTRQSLFK